MYLSADAIPNEPLEVFARFDDFVIDAGCLAIISNQDATSSKLERAKAFGAMRDLLTRLLSGLFGHPAKPVFLDSPESAPLLQVTKNGAVEVPLFKCSGRIVLFERPNPMNDHKMLCFYDYIVKLLTSRPRQYVADATVWYEVFEYAESLIRAFIQSAFPDSEPRTIANLILSTYPSDSGIDIITRGVSALRIKQGIESLTQSRLSNSFGDAILSRMQSRVRAQYWIHWAVKLYLNNESDLERIAEAQRGLATEAFPDVSAEAYATRCEYYAYLCKKVSLTDTVQQDSFRRVQNHLSAIESLSSAIGAFPRPRLAKYIADHTNHLSQILEDKDMATISTLVYTYWYAMPYYSCLERIHDHTLQTEDDRQFIIDARARSDTKVTTIVDASMRGDLAIKDYIHRCDTSTGSNAIRDVTAGAVHNILLTRDCADLAADLCEISKLPRSPFCDDILETYRKCATMNLLTSINSNNVDLSSRISEEMCIAAWDLCYSPATAAGIKVAARHVHSQVRAQCNDWLQRSMAAKVAL